MNVTTKLKKSRTSLAVLLMCSMSGAYGSGFHTQNGSTTGGAGGDVVRATTGKQIHEALCNRNTSETPIIIEVEGIINHGNTEKVSGNSCNTADDKIELKEISNVTLIGVGQGALFDELGIHIRDSTNIIIRNVHVRNVKKSGSPTSNGGDAIGIETDVRNVWVDHVTLEASGGESEGYDGLFDVKDNSKYITLSYSHLLNSGRGGLVGSSESQVNNGPLTYHHNIFENLNSRVPLVRGATAHIYNNHYDGIESSGINSRAGAEVKVENNYFEDAKDVLGTFYTTTDGDWHVAGNIFGSGVTWSSSDDDYQPAGPNVVSTTSVGIPYSYTLDNASCVRDILQQTAGANKNLQVSDGSCGTTGGGENGGGDNGGGDNGGGDNGGGDNGGGDNGGTPSGVNLSLSADADGSSKASGTSYSNVKDGDTSTYWSPNGSTGRVSIKGLDTTINAVRIVERSGAEGRVTSWRLVNNDTGSIITSGNTIPDPITFSDVSLGKLNFVIDSSSSTPQIAEFEIYFGLDSNGGGSSDGGSNVVNGTVNGIYRITPVHSGRSFDVANCGTTSGANIRQWEWLDNDCQKFTISQVDGIWHRISPLNASQQSLEISNNSTFAGENVQLWQYSGGHNQLFRFQSAGSGKWRIVARNSELCLDIAGQGGGNGANIIQWTCIAQADNQMFELTRQ